MKILVQMLLFLGILSSLGVMDVSAESSLQAKIDATPEGGTLEVKTGIYNEPIILNKPITLKGGNGVIFQVCSSKPAIQIKGKNITITGIKIKGCIGQKTIPTISVTGSGHKVMNMSIDSESTGIKVEKTHDSIFEDITINGVGKENGFDLWESPHNTFTNIRLQRVQDGFYMENSDSNTFIQNNIRDSRYGIHIMFSNEISIKDNVSTRNFTGAMIMGTTNSVITGNQFFENNRNVNSQGLLLYDVHESKINHNKISQNRVGLFMDQSSENFIQNNEFMANFIGAQLNHFKNNTLNNNSFMSNVSEIQAYNGSHNKIEKNYWDASMTLDTDGDGLSNLPYKMDPYFLNLSNETPPYQLFFQHPGMLLLQKMLKSPDQLIVTDKKPLMENPIKKNAKHDSPQTKSWAMSLVMIFFSLYIIKIGRKKQR